MNSKSKIIIGCVGGMALLTGLHIYLTCDLASGGTGSTEVQAIAALVQAVGAVAALYVAIRLNRDDSELSRSERIEEANGKRLAILAVAQAASEFVCTVSEHVEKSKEKKTTSLALYEVFSPPIVESYLNALRGIPLHEVGSGEAVRAIIMFALHLELFGKQVSVYMGGVHNAPQFSRKSLEGLNAKERSEILDQRFMMLCNTVAQQSQLVRNYHDTLIEQLPPKHVL